MSWDEVLDLAKRFPKDGQGDNRIYGFASSGAFLDKKRISLDLMSSIGWTSGLSYVDAGKGTVTLQSEGWKNALVTAMEALKSGAVYTGTDNKPDPNKTVLMDDGRSLFAAGKVAMTLDGSYAMPNLQNARNLPEDPPVNWDIVTVPVGPQNPDVSNAVSLSDLFAVNVDSSNPRAAWELVKFINSDEMAKLQAKSEDGSLLSRTAYVKERNGRSFEPFYMLKTNEDMLMKGVDTIPFGFNQPFNEMAGTEILAVIEGTKSVDEALKTMQEKGQEIYIKAKREQDANNAKEN